MMEHLELLHEWNEENRFNVVHEAAVKFGDLTVISQIVDEQGKRWQGDHEDGDWFTTGQILLTAVYEGETLKRFMVMSPDHAAVPPHRTQVLIDDVFTFTRDDADDSTT